MKRTGFLLKFILLPHERKWNKGPVGNTHMLTPSTTPPTQKRTSQIND